MGITSRFGLRYPAGIDPATIAAYFQHLAEDSDAAIRLRSFKAFSLDTLQTRNVASFDWLGTPDRVNVDVETNGLLLVAYRALWWAGGAGIGSHGASAGLFVGADEVKLPRAEGAPTTAEADVDDTAKWSVLSTDALRALTSWQSDTTDSSFAATPQLLGSFGNSTNRFGGIAVIENIAAGNYDVGVKFKIDLGTVSVKNRRLWVASLAPPS